jgi:hypothetical protein
LKKLGSSLHSASFSCKIELIKGKITNMKTQKYSLAILVTILLIERTCKSSFAFYLTGQTTSQSASLPMAVPALNINGTVTVTTKDITEIKLGGTDEFLNVLRQSYGAFSQFEPGSNLEGGFNVKTYYPCTPGTSCGAELNQVDPSFSAKSGGIGASIFVDYEGYPQQPLAYDSVHWIQRIKADTGGQLLKFSDNLTAAYFDLIDIPSRDSLDPEIAKLPWYPGSYSNELNPATGWPSYTFYDVPYNATQEPKPSFVYDHDWNFELYLVSFEGTANSLDKYKIYHGMSWGWTSKFTPCVPSSGGGGCEPGNSTQAVSANVYNQGLNNNSTANFALKNGHKLTMKDIYLAGISSKLLQDPQLSYVDDTLTAKTQNVSSNNTDDDALPVEAVPEPTTALGTLFALAILPVITRLKNRKNKE